MTILKILSPLIGFLVYIVYLATLSTDPFLEKWLNGSFALFLALVLANIIRSSLRDDGGSDDR